MINIAYITNCRSPYRKLQFEEFSQIQNIKFNIYYTNKNYIGRKWKVDPVKNVNEHFLSGIKLFKNYGYVNFRLKHIIKNNDLIILGGYEQPTYILLSLLSRINKKPYVLVYDGISPLKILHQKDSFKYYLKLLVIKNANAIFGNGQVSKLLFKAFNYDSSKIFNQYLTIDVKKIFKLSKDKDYFRKLYRQKYNISLDNKEIIYSGRLIKRKNVDLIIRAISKINDGIILLILGDGEEKSNLIKLANKLNVKIYITGFISEQEELFKHYFCGDLLILPSENEPWGLVVNEAMAAGLPVIASNSCGVSLDLVKDNQNGYVVKTNDLDDLIAAIKNVFRGNKNNVMGGKSKKIISSWTFKESKNSFMKLLEYIKEI